MGSEATARFSLCNQPDHENREMILRRLFMKKVRNVYLSASLGPQCKNSSALIKTMIQGIFLLALSLLGGFYRSHRLSLQRHSDGPPHDLIVRGKLDHYAPFPETHRRKFYTEGKGADTITRAFRSRGWTLVASPKDAHFVYFAKGGQSYFSTLEPWQRVSRMAGFGIMESKDTFFAGLKQYQSSHPSETDLYFLPKTFRLSIDSDQKAFENELKIGGTNRPWVLKNANENNGKGISILAPNSPGLFSAVSRTKEEKGVYIVQEYVCQELTWFKGEKFDLRMYWLVASVDPVIVLYHDGYVRVGGAKYDESDFSNTANHLTNHAFRTEDQSEVTMEFLEKRIREHFRENYSRLSKMIRIDPVEHVRNQMKESLSTVVAAFHEVTFGNSNITYTPENQFGFYGVDFAIDEDLDVFSWEVQASPGFGSSYDYRIDMFRELYRPMVDIVEEITLKQQADPNANILPLTPEKLGGWQLIYAGDWRYKYGGYRRSRNKKGCSIAEAK